MYSHGRHLMLSTECAAKAVDGSKTHGLPVGLELLQYGVCVPKVTVPSSLSRNYMTSYDSASTIASTLLPEHPIGEESH